MCSYCDYLEREPRPHTKSYNDMCISLGLKKCDCSKCLGEDPKEKE